MSRILGISAFYHDSAAALVVEGEIRAAAQEERFSRVKQDAGYPEGALAFCLREGGNLKLSDLDAVVFYEKPFLKFERLIETYLAFAPMGFSSFRKALPLWLREKLFQKDFLLKRLEKQFGEKLPPEKLLFSEHHLSHAASAFYPSPFEEAVVLTMDGVGEWATSSVALGKGRDLQIKKEIHFPHSLGLLYAAFTYYLGFKVNSGEYKVMGLAPYGKPIYKELIFEHLITLKEDGSFRLNMKFFNYATGLTMVNQNFVNLFGQPIRRPEEDALTPFHQDVAASIQAVCEEVVMKIVRALHKEYQKPFLCLAGGVALNCVANGKILKEGPFEKIWIQPAAGDAGGALGAALAAHHLHFQKERKLPDPAEDRMKGAYLGPSFSQAEIEARLKNCGAHYETLSEEEMILRTVQSLEKGEAVGWFQGALEFGPRALGNRSILGDPRNPGMQKLLNLKIKFRESFRPFAPSVLKEKAHEWFDLKTDSPYMLLVAEVSKNQRLPVSQEAEGFDRLKIPRSRIPAVTHVDDSARIQTVDKKTNPLYHRLLSKFEEHTGCPVLVNTSFNVRGEPIVCTPEDAFHCFMGTDLDVLVCGNAFLRKADQPASLKRDYKNLYELD